MLRIVSLGSGSSGNVYIVEDESAALMIDCGLSCRETGKRAEAAGVNLAKVRAILFTHDHSDHTKGLRTFHKHNPEVALFANYGTAAAIARDTGIAEDEFYLFENGQSFEVGPFEVLPFPIPHDVPDPVGYLVKKSGLTYFHVTDCGSPIDSVGRMLATADLATLESDYDPGLLATSDRDESLKRRIRGPRGHLSNDDAADLVRRYASPKLKYLALAHLSGECNEPVLAERTMRATLAAMGREDITLEIDPRGAVSRGFAV